MADCFSSKTLRRIGKEVNSLRNQPPEGIRVVLNEDDITELKAWIQGPAETPYQSTFSTKIFHPNVGPKGEICVNTLKKDWTSSQTLTDILTVIKCLLIYPNPESALDEEAGRLLLENYDEYRQRAKLWTDIHAKNKPIGLFDRIDPDSQVNNITQPINSSNTMITDLKPTMLPFASSNQGYHNQIEFTTPKLLQSDQDCNEKLIKASTLIHTANHPILNTHPIEGENLNPPSINLPKATNLNSTNTINTTKDKDRRGRKRL